MLTLVISKVDKHRSYFGFKNPTLIQDRPRNRALKQFKLEVQANASSVESNLGSGDHEYLELVLSFTKYV